ncbi:SMI1/KNR4 family protein, partial [Rossellomorea marisflavi]|uniref:SMI1/KNR4 family protein n=1 Tax=Rossellomorea marisflavi TaxID=189381 RepID=UPI00295F5102
YQPIEITPVTPKDGFDSISGFYGFVSNSFNLMSVIQTYKDMLGGSVLPIADADGGDLICMGLKGEYEGGIYYWYHEGDTGGNGQEYYYLVANSFEEFIRNFSLHEREQNVNLDDIDMFLDEDLLKD